MNFYSPAVRTIAKLIGFFAPGTAVSYLRNHTKLRSYDAAATTGSHNENWNPHNRTGDQEISRDWKTVLGRARDLDRNNPLIADAIRIGMAFTVGNALDPQWNILQADKSRDEASIDKTEYRFWKWAEDCTIDGKDWQETKELVYRHRKIDGELFVIFTADTYHPFKLQLVEADQIDETIDGDMKNGNHAIRGIEFNRFGRAVAFHFHDVHPGSLGIGKKTIRISSDRVLHVYSPNRITETRGICSFVSSIMSLYDQNELSDQILLLHRVAAAYGIFIESETAAEDLAALSSQKLRSSGEKIQYIDPASVNYLQDGQKVSSAKPEMPSTAFADFNKSYLRKGGKGIGLSYETFTGDLSGANFSSLKAGQNSERAIFRMESDSIIRKFIRPVCEHWQDIDVASGLLHLPDYWSNRDHYQRKRFTLPALPSTDPIKDEKADALALSNGTDNRRRICERKGIDYDENLEELKAEAIDYPQIRVTAPMTPSGEEDLADEEEDQAEDQAGDQTGDQT